jgi:hypothetical protein
MRHSTHCLSLLIALFFLVGKNQAQTLWQGPKIIFEKKDFADWTKAENQDRITDDLWITRGNSLPIYNISEQIIGPSPQGTLWAWGKISDGIENLDFGDWLKVIEEEPPQMVDSNMVLFLVTDSIYIDIRFTSWTEGNSGGGFSYERSTGTVSEHVWTGPKTTITKNNNADWKLASNQDRITDNVWLTRADRRGLFNIAVEESFAFKGNESTIIGSPKGTEWAYGSIADGVETLDFDIWVATNNESPPTMVNKDMVLHLLEEDIYIDVKYTSWTQGNNGGGFSYERSTGLPTEKFWTGPKITFTKVDSADWTKEENQDRITSKVWLTRQDKRGLFNIAQERSYLVGFNLPSNTQWAIGSISDGIENLDFNYFLNTVQEAPPDYVDSAMVLHVVSKDIYIDIKFTSWTSGEDGGGGGFAYERSTAGTTTSRRMEDMSIARIYPNPASGVLSIEMLNNGQSADFQLYDALGNLVHVSRVQNRVQLDVSVFPSGIYMYSLVTSTGLMKSGKLILD